VSIIIPELQFFEIQGEPFSGDAMMFHEPLLGPVPKSLLAVNVDPSGGAETSNSKSLISESHCTQLNRP